MAGMSVSAATAEVVLRNIAVRATSEGLAAAADGNDRESCPYAEGGSDANVKRRHFWLKGFDKVTRRQAAPAI